MNLDRTVIDEYKNIANTIKSTNDKLKVLRARLKELDKKISNDMIRNSLSIINLTEGGRIERKKTNRKLYHW